MTARAVVTGGSASNQAPLYCQGRFRDVWFYPEDVAAHAGRSYQPGE